MITVEMDVGLGCFLRFGSSGYNKEKFAWIECTVGYKKMEIYEERMETINQVVSRQY